MARLTGQMDKSIKQKQSNKKGASAPSSILGMSVYQRTDKL